MKRGCIKILMHPLLCLCSFVFLFVHKAFDTHLRSFFERFVNAL